MRKKKSYFYTPSKPVSCISFPSCLSGSEQRCGILGQEAPCALLGAYELCLLQWRKDEMPEIKVAVVAACCMPEAALPVVQE